MAQLIETVRSRLHAVPCPHRFYWYYSLVLFFRVDLNAILDLNAYTSSDMSVEILIITTCMSNPLLSFPLPFPPSPSPPSPSPPFPSLPPLSSSFPFSLPSPYYSNISRAFKSDECCSIDPSTHSHHLDKVYILGLLLNIVISAVWQHVTCMYMHLFSNYSYMGYGESGWGCPLINILYPILVCQYCDYQCYWRCSWREVRRMVTGKWLFVL